MDKMPPAKSTRIRPRPGKVKATPPAITPQQMKTARGLLGWSRERLGAWSEVSANFIAVFEKQGRIMIDCPSALHEDQVAQVRSALEAAGVRFPFTAGGTPELGAKPMPAEIVAAEIEASRTTAHKRR